MSSLGTFKDTIGVVNEAAKLLNSAPAAKVGNALLGAVKTYDHFDKTGNALSSITNQTSIISRVFIEDQLVEEIPCANLMKTFHEWYAAQILASLQLTRFVTDGHTVQDYMTVIQTGQQARQRSVLGNVLARAGAQESFVENLEGEGSIALENMPGYSGTVGGGQPKKVTPKPRFHDEPKYDAAKPTEAKQPNVSMQSIQVSNNKIGPLGEMFEVTLTNPSNKDASVKVPIYVQLQPSLIPTDIAPRFIDMNVDPSAWQRMTMMKAGEISFWKDFVFKKDLMKRRMSVVKDPRAAKAFSEFLKTVVKKDEYALGDVTDKFGAAKSANLANSIIVLSEDTVQRCRADSGIDLNNENDRKRYLRDSYAMILVVVDTMHQRIKIWFNGIDGTLDCSYNDFKRDKKGLEAGELVNALQAFSTNSIGRLR